MKYVVVQLLLAGEQAPAHPGVLGFGVLNLESMQFMNSSAFWPNEFEQANKRLQELEDADKIKANWPDARDPDVIALLSDPDFGLEYNEEWSLTTENGIEVETIPANPIRRIHKACEIVARSRAGL